MGFLGLHGGVFDKGGVFYARIGGNVVYVAFVEVLCADVAVPAVALVQGVEVLGVECVDVGGQRGVGLGSLKLLLGGVLVFAKQQYGEFYAHGGEVGVIGKDLAQQADGFAVTFLLAGDLGLGEQDEVEVGLGVGMLGSWGSLRSGWAGMMDFSGMVVGASAAWRSAG